MPRKAHQYHYIYKITNLKNNKYYIGMHSTSNLDDGYMGGGVRIRNSIRKHGKEIHKKEILEYLPDRISLAAKEKEIVNENLLKDPLCMNLMIGGEGGGFINDSHRLKAQKFGGISSLKIMRNKLKEKELMDPELKKKRYEKIRESHHINNNSGNGWIGKKHSDETKKKIGESNSKNTKEKNSQFGKKWMYNIELKKNIKLNPDEINNYIKNGWILGRKIIF